MYVMYVMYRICVGVSGDLQENSDQVSADLQTCVLLQTCRTRGHHLILTTQKSTLARCPCDSPSICWLVHVTCDQVCDAWQHHQAAFLSKASATSHLRYYSSSPSLSPQTARWMTTHWLIVAHSTVAVTVWWQVQQVVRTETSNAPIPAELQLLHDDRGMYS